MEKVIFMKNITHNEKINLLKNSIALLYTTKCEDFGIVPLESMYNGVPVIASN